MVTLIFTSCRKSVEDDPGDCMVHIEKVNTSLNDYINDPSVENCKAYLNAIRSYIKSNACFGNIFFDEYQRALKELEDDECN